MQRRFRTHPPLALDKTQLKSMAGERRAEKHSFLHHNGCLQFSSVVKSVIENVNTTELASAKYVKSHSTSLQLNTV